MTPDWLALRKDWTWHSVGELQAKGVLLVEDGNHGEYRPRPDEFADEGTAFLRAADLSDGVVLFSSAGRINDVALQRIRKGVGKPGDVLFSHKGTVGKLAVAPDDAPPFVCSPQTTFWRVVDQSQLDRGFLFAYMRAPEFKRQWTVRKGDTDMADYVSLTAQRTLLVPVPPLSTQRKIAAIVSAYDNLIENNSRRIKVLEEIAQRIYREWFVDFRYPGHEDVPLVDSELGPIPQGWSIAALSSLAEAITRGVSPKYSDAADQLVINQRCIRGRALDLGPARLHMTAVPPIKIVRVGDILINSTGVGTLGRVAQVLFAPSGLTVDSHVTIVRPAPAGVTIDFLGMTLLERESELAAMGVGSTGQTELGRAAIGELKVVLPPMRCQDDFSDAAGVLRRLPLSLAEVTANLRATRDLLLPRLISGEVDVSGFDIAVPEEAA